MIDFTSKNEFAKNAAIINLVHAGELLVAVALGMRSEYITPEIAIENWRKEHERLMEVIYAQP